MAKSIVDEATLEEFLIPPNTELNSPEGQEARVKLLRAWVETSAYLADYQRRFGKRYFWFPHHLLMKHSEHAQELHATPFVRQNRQRSRDVPAGDRCTP